jgi:hypothetical protein
MWIRNLNQYAMLQNADLVFSKLNQSAPLKFMQHTIG